MYFIQRDCGNQDPKKPEIYLSFTASEPVVLHVNGFGFSLDVGVIINPNCGEVITLDGIFETRPTHLNKGIMNLDLGFGVDEESRNFGFGIRGHNKLDYLGGSENMAISGRYMGVF